MPWGNHAHLLGSDVPVVETPFLPMYHALIVWDGLMSDPSPVLIVGMGTLNPRQQAMIDYNRMIRAKVKEILGWHAGRDVDWGFHSAEIIGATFDTSVIPAR